MSFTPDSALVDEVRASPNHGERAGGRAPDMLILHYTGMETAAAALDWLCDVRSQVSAHYFVHEDGRILQLVPEARRAWHAGLACWAGEEDINSCSIGIEVVNGGHDAGNPPFPAEQMQAVAGLCGDIAARRGIRPARVLAHSDVAPARKQDPGVRFDWALLAAHGAGIWVAPAPIVPGPVLDAGSTGGAVERAQERLARIGYQVAVTGIYDDATRLAVTAFQRHFRPALVDGSADGSTLETMRRVERMMADSSSSS